MREAMQNVTTAVESMRAGIETGRSEVEVWSELHRGLIAGDGEYISTRLAQTGHRTFPYFNEAGTTAIRDGDLFCIDTDAIGPRGYAVDFSRTFSCGDASPTAVQANVEISNGRWFIVIDPMYSQLETDLMLGPISGTVEVDMLLADLLVGFNVSPNVGVYAGVRYYDQDIKLIPNNLPSTTVGEDWTDFNAGIRLTAEINDKWSFGGKVDAAVGGDSDSALYFQAVLLRHIGERMHLDFGYRYYSVDYESGSGLTRFKWDVDHSGPVIGYSWTF